MAGLHAIRQSNYRVLPYGARYYVLWLACGHPAGVGRPGYQVHKRKCDHCGSRQDVVRIEPRDE